MLTNQAPKNKSMNELAQEIATLIAEGFLAFHPTSPMNLRIQVALQAYRKDPESKLVNQIMAHCQQEINALVLSVV